MFNALDYIIMSVYLAGIIGLGFYLKRMASASIQDYFLGANKLPWWAMGLSGMASQLDMTGTMILVSMIFMFGMRGMYIEVRGGLALLMAFAMVYQGKWNRRSGCMTVAEWMEYRFGNGYGGQLARLMGAITTLVLSVGMLAYFVVGAGLFLSMFLPYSPATCALIMVIVGTLYTMMSGFYGVVYTDLFQAGFIIAAMLFVAISAYLQIPDNASFSELVAQVSGNDQWMSASIPIHTAMPRGYEAFEHFAFAIFVYLVLVVFIGMGRSGGRPNYFGARNERECGTQTFVWLISSAVRWPLIIGLAVLGFYLVADMYPDQQVLHQAADIVRVHVPDVREHNWGEVIARVMREPAFYSPELAPQLASLLGDDWPQKLQMVNYHGLLNSEQILPAVIIYVIPSGFKGLLLVAFVAAAMSTFDSLVNMAAAYFVRDVYQRRIRPHADNKELIRVSHITCVVLVAAGYMFGYYTTTINEIWGWLMVGLGSGLGMAHLLRWHWWRLNGIGFTVGLFVGTIAAVLQRFLWPGLALWYSFPLIMGASLVGMLITTYRTAPTDKKTLVNFYTTTRPFGFWKPLKKELSPEQLAATRKEHRNDIISLVFAVPWQFLLYWTPIQLVVHAYRNFFISLILLGICSVGLYIFWYKNLPEPTASLSVKV